MVRDGFGTTYINSRSILSLVLVVSIGGRAPQALTAVQRVHRSTIPESCWAIYDRPRERRHEPGEADVEIHYC